jgi:hypothetical protein
MPKPYKFTPKGGWQGGGTPPVYTSTLHYHAFEEAFYDAR